MKGVFDFCPWKQIAETFSGDGIATDFRLLRRLADVTLPNPSGVNWTAVTRIGGAPVPNPTFGSPDANGITPVAFVSPPEAGSSNLSIFYVPVYLVRVVKQTRDMQTPFAEGRVLTLEEL
jgi:hypothetical protein